MAVATTHAAATAVIGETQRIALSAITPVQMREQTNERIVRQYAADMVRPSQVFPPIVLFFDGEHYWLADGMHRWCAAQTLSLPDILARMLEGGEREAVEYAALEAPKDHSKVPYGEGDKQLRVKRMWEMHPEWHHGAWSERKIAESCGVSPDTVRKAKERYDLSDSPLSDKSIPIDTPSPVTTPVQESATEPAPQPTVTVTRTSKHGKVTTYQQRQPTRQSRQQQAEMEQEEMEAPAEVETTDSIEDGPDLAFAMKMNTVISYMANFHNKVQAILGDDVLDKAMLDAWWQNVEPRDWQAFQEHFNWLYQGQVGSFVTAIYGYMKAYHRDNGHWTTPPMVRELAPVKPKRKQA